MVWADLVWGVLHHQVSQMRELFQAASYVPLVLEQLPHAAQIEHAIRSIFKCYVKGQFAPAETVRRPAPDSLTHSPRSA